MIGSTAMLTGLAFALRASWMIALALIALIGLLIDALLLVDAFSTLIVLRVAFSFAFEALEVSFALSFESFEAFESFAFETFSFEAFAFALELLPDSIDLHWSWMR